MLRVLEHVPAGTNLLDVGAGHGVFARLAIEGGARRAVAVEPDWRKVLPVDRVLFVAGYDQAVAGVHDVVSIIDVLYRIPLAEWDALLSRVHDRLRPGGLLLVKEQDPTARLKNAWNRLQERGATAARLTLGDAFSYETPVDFAARLERHGFEEIRVERIDAWYPHPHVLYVAKRR